MNTSEVHEKNLGKGIDQRNSENSIESGYWEDLKNAETDGNIVKKRKGYQQLGGYLPFRVQSIEWDELEICFNLDTYVDLSRLRSAPLVVKGTAYSTPSANFDFVDGEFNTQYYNEFGVTIRRTPTISGNPPSGTFTVPQAAHGHNSWIQHANFYISDSLSNLSNERAYGVHEINAPATLTTTKELDSTDITVNQTANYIHASIDASELGINHYYPNENTDKRAKFTTKLIGSPLVMNFDVDADTELLSSNLIISTYRRVSPSTTKIEKVIPDDITISGTDVNITITNATDTSDYFYVASAVPDSQVVAGQVTGAVQDVVLSDVTPFTSFAVYTVDNTGTREYVLPDTAVYDDTTSELTISFQTSDSINYQIYYLEESLRVNQFCVDRNVFTGGPNGSVSTVEMDVYGIDPLEVMEEENRNHWLTHIDTYRSSTLNKLVTGVAGNEYELSSPGLIDLFPRMELVLGTSQYLTPLFLETPPLTITNGRGYILCDDGFAGPEITDVTYQSDTGFVRFTLTCDNLDDDNFSNIDNDLLTVENCGYSIMNGDHVIESIDTTTTTDTVYIYCTVSGVTNSDFDETDVGGYAQVYTSPITIDTTPILDNSLIPGSRITVAGNEYTVRGNSFASEEKLYLSGVTGISELSAGLFVLGSTTSDVIPTRDTSVATVGEYVKGDMVKYTSFDRWIRIKDIIQLSTKPVTLTSDVVDFGMGSTDALNFEAGQRIMIASEGLEGSVVDVVSVINAQTLQVSKGFSATSGRLIGKTIEIDESIEVSDTVNNSLSFTQTARWHSIPKVSVPDDFADSLKTVQYPFNAFTTTSQETIKSTMVADNLYMTNGEDAVIKYDGINLSRAGLFRWEGATFVRKVDSTGGAIPYTGTLTTGTSDATDRVFTAAAGTAKIFTIGETVRTNFGDNVVIKEVDTTNDEITVTSNLNSATSLASISDVKYYFRLNIVDANDNIIGSAASGSDGSYVIDITAATTIGIKLAKPPTINLLDYNRLEYEIYRTAQGGAIFFKVATLQIPYTDDKSYVYFEDTVADENLSEDDPVSTSTVGAELATAIDEPMRAKYITSANNRLVLGNLKDSHKVDVKIYRPSTEQTDAQLDGLTFKFTNTDNEIDYQFIDDISPVTVTINTVGALATGATVNEGDWVYIYKPTDGDENPGYLGWFKATAANTIEYSGAASTGTLNILVGDADTIPILAGEEYTDADAGYQFADNQQRIQIKLCNAIAATQYRLPEFALSTEGRTDGTELGRFSIRSLQNKAFSLTITSANLFGVSSIFINNNAASSGVAVNSVEQNYSSRMLVSFPNFPEIMDRPRAIIPEDSQSVIDVNSADGQEITGIIPFFGDSTSQDSRKQDIVICFKENSIYAVNVSTRQITKIDSRGVGCNAPHSITTVPNGVIFAARSGVYRLNRAFDVIWVGRNLDRKWSEGTNLDRLDLATGHVYPEEKQYRLSVAPLNGAGATEVYVYDYGDEAQGQVGGWTLFDNIPSTGWASDGVESYFASSKGRMYTIRNTGTDSDYRDDDAGVVWEGTYRGMDFGAPGRRKIVRAIISHFRVLKTDSGTSLEVGVDLTDEFTATSSFILKDSIDDGLSTIISSKVKSIRQNIPSQKGIYFQVKYSNSTIDTPVSLCGITFHVAGLDYKGIIQASET